MLFSVDLRWSSGTDIGRWESLSSNTKRVRQINSLKQKSLILLFNFVIMPLDQSGLIDLYQLESSVLHDGAVREDQLPDLAVII